jgi:hypothetical protein
VIDTGEAAAGDFGVEDSSFEALFAAFNFVARAGVGVVDCFMAGFLVVRGLLNIPFLPLRRFATSHGGRPSHPIYALQRASNYGRSLSRS